MPEASCYQFPTNPITTHLHPQQSEQTCNAPPIILLCLVPLLVALIFLAAAQEDFSRYVDPFHGTEQGGNVFPGVVAGPFAPVKLGPDVESGTRDAYAGYLPDGNVTGFSLMHESGTGGAPKYGVVAQMPVVGEVTNPLADLSVGRASPDDAHVGYYKSSLANGVTVELAATDHVGYYQYSFTGGQRFNVVVDVSHVLPSFRGMGWDQRYRSGEIKIFSDGHYEGRGTYYDGWNLAPDWTIYFCGRFDQSYDEAKTFINSTDAQGSNVQKVAGDESLGAIFSFSDRAVISRVGASWISSIKACRYVEDETPNNVSLQDLVDRAKTRWNNGVFSKIVTNEQDTTKLSHLYSSMYGMHLMPSNRTGENPGWESDEPYYDDFFTLWDTFRCTTPLVHILQPEAYEEQIRALIDIWRFEGYTPGGRSSNYNGRTQGGSNSDNVLADAFIKGVRGKVNWQDGLLSMKTNAEVTPPNQPIDPSAPDSSTKEGRGALPDWLNLGFVSTRFTRSVSRAVEYSVNDFALYQAAQQLGTKDERERYLGRSKNWRNHWNPQATALNVTGFLGPRDSNGTFLPFDPTSCGGCYWGDAYYQATPWAYTMDVHHDIATLISYAGGPDAFVDRLNIMLDPAHGLYDPGNEPSFATPYLYNFVSRQDLSVKQSRFVANKYFKLGRDGLPGNSDAGAMQSWILWNMIGLYPLTGQTTFLVGSPWFEEMSISLGGGNANGKEKTLRISRNAVNSSTDAYYVQSLKVNGEAWTKNWIEWSDVFENGGSMEFVVGEQPRGWDTGPPPPSPASAAGEEPPGARV